MIGTTEAAYLLGICCQRVRKLLKEGRIIGAVKVGRFWQIPLFNGMPKIIEMNRKQQGTWRKLPQRAMTLIHVNRHKIDANRTDGSNLPAVTVRQGKNKTYCHSAVIDGPSRIVYRPHKPLSCGARLWIEVEPHINIKTELFGDSEVCCQENTDIWDLYQQLLLFENSPVTV